MPEGIIRNEPAFSMYSDQDGYNVFKGENCKKSQQRKKVTR